MKQAEVTWKHKYTHIHWHQKLYHYPRECHQKIVSTRLTSTWWNTSVFVLFLHLLSKHLLLHSCGRSIFCCFPCISQHFVLLLLFFLMKHAWKIQECIVKKIQDKHGWPWFWMIVHEVCNPWTDSPMDKDVWSMDMRHRYDTIWTQ